MRATVPGSLNLLADDLTEDDIVPIAVPAKRSAQTTLGQLQVFTARASAQVVASLTALKALISRPEAVIVKAGQAAGEWQWVADDVTTPDDALVVEPTAGPDGRYKRIYEAGYHYAEWFGVSDDNPDCFNALQAAVNSFPDNQGTLILPSGTIRTSDQIELPATAFDSAVLIIGAGKTATTVQAIQGATVWTGKGVFYRGNANVVLGGGLRDLSVDAAKVADYGVHFATGKATIMESITVTSAVVTEGLYGDPAVPRFYETKFLDCEFYSGNAIDPEDRPDYNLRLIGFATDNEIIKVVAANAKLANIRDESGGNTFIGCHPFGATAGLEADYCIRLDDSSSAVDCYADGFAIAGIYLAGSETSAVACRFFYPSSVTGTPVLIATGLTNITCCDHSYFDLPPGMAEVTFAGTFPSASYIQSGLLYTTGAQALIGHSASLSVLSNARLQISGTTFQASAAALGRWSDDAGSSTLFFYKSRATDIGTHGIVAASDNIGILEWHADDGVANQPAARISVQVGNTPGAGDMPGQMQFLTTTDGGVTLAIRLVFDCFGNATFGAGAIATNASDGFVYIPAGAGTPTGTPRTKAGRVPLYVDTTNNKLYFYSTGAWRDAGP